MAVTTPKFPPPPRNAQNSFLVYAQEIDARRDRETVDVQATEPVRLSAFQGEALGDVAKAIVAKEPWRRRDDQLLTYRLADTRDIEVEPQFSNAPNAVRAALDRGPGRRETHGERPVRRWFSSLPAGFYAPTDGFQHDRQARKRVRRQIAP
jgi:hypothetical protein